MRSRYELFRPQDLSLIHIFGANIAVINECEYESAFQAALVIILVEGIVFLILTLLKVREKIVEAIPLGVRYGIAPAIGLMLMNVGLGSNVGIYSENGGPFYMMREDVYKRQENILCR